ncbi:hypothetical protein GF406_16265 [candidate division KSB1 bacterium]|nr:hypothetical protein [candidate division KSB1 bacterium]
MKYLNFWLCLILFLACSTSPDSVFEVLSHKLKIQLDPDSHRMIAIDTIHVKSRDLTQFSFLLHETLEITSIRIGNQELHYTVDMASGSEGIPELKNSASNINSMHKIEVMFPPSLDPQYIEIHYEGNFLDSALTNHTENAMLTPPGIYLRGRSFWYPYFPNQKSSMRLVARSPRGFRILTSGELIHYTESLDSIYCVWQQDQPVQEFFLCAADYWKNTRFCNNVLLSTWLLNDDHDLSDHYLATCSKYISRFESLIGPYPFKQYVLAEHIFPEPLSLPAINLFPSQQLQALDTIDNHLAHEICKNWWSRGVQVEPSSGDWSEPLNLYYSEYLNQEKMSKEYRYKKMVDFACLEKNRQIALEELNETESPLAKDINSSKGVMIVYQLRYLLGKDRFDKGMQSFYSTYLGSAATWYDLKDTLEHINDQELDGFFEQWLTRKGAPQISLENVMIEQKGTDSLVTLYVTQSDPVYDLEIPVVINTPDETISTKLHLDDNEKMFRIPCKHPPKKISLDPDYHVFRSLDPKEISSKPPAENVLTWNSE